MPTMFRWASRALARLTVTPPQAHSQWASRRGCGVRAMCRRAARADRAQHRPQRGVNSANVVGRRTGDAGKTVVSLLLPGQNLGHRGSTAIVQCRRWLPPVSCLFLCLLVWPPPGQERRSPGSDLCYPRPFPVTRLVGGQRIHQRPVTNSE
jgi:hypothetical protein